VIAGHLGDSATARSYLADPDESVRASALGAVARAGGLGADDLAAAWADPAARVRARAAELSAQALSDQALGDREPAADEPAAGWSAAGGPEAPLAPTWGPQAIRWLIAGLADTDWRVVEASCFALGEIGSRATDAVGALTRVATGHTDALCREAAVAALGAVGSPDGLEAILVATTDKPAVRRRAVLALAPFEGPSVQAALERALEDRDWQVRQAAEDLIGPPD